MSERVDARPVQIHEGEDLLNKLGIAICDFRIFGAGHPRFLESCEAFLRLLREYFEEHPEQRNLLFVQRQGQVLFRRVPLATLTPPAIKVTRLLRDRSVEGLRFGPDCNLTGLSTAVEGLCGNGVDGWQEVNRRLESEGVLGRIGFFSDHELGSLEAFDDLRPSTVGNVQPGSPLLRLPQLALPIELYRSTLAALHDLMMLLGSGGNPGFGSLIDVAQRITTGMIDGEQSFLPLATVRYREQFTFNHSVNVCLLATAALKPFVNDRERLMRIGQAALLHDLGKSLVPQEIFYGAKPPDGDEIALLRRHPQLGAEILLDANDIDPMSAVVAYDHHRRPDGGGYPRCLRKREIDSVTAVVAAADLFEALTAERPYKRSLMPAEAFGVLLRLPEARGLETAVRLLFDTLSPYPPGTFVELDSGDRAVVTRVHRGQPDRPIVRLVGGTEQEPTVSDEEIDLSIDDTIAPRLRIVRALDGNITNDARDDAEASGEAGSLREHERLELERRIVEGTLLSTEG